VKIVNATLLVANNEQAAKWQMLPNGIIKVAFEFFDDSDKNILQFTFFEENRFYLQHDVM